MKIKVYSKKTVEHDYPEGLANSIHMSLVCESETKELNQGYGMIFVPGQIISGNVISPRGVINPTIYKENEKYVICADYVDENCNNMAEGMVYKCLTEDFINFEHIGLVDKDDKGSSEVEIDECLVKNIEDRWIPLKAVNVILPKKAKREDLKNIKATVLYSDGSEDQKPIDWSDIGADSAKGRIRMPEYNYPIMRGFADPQVFKLEGRWYCLSTNDNNDDVGIYLKSADSPENLFKEGYKESVILDYNEEKEYIQTFWAPEYHEIGGESYILFALGGKKWAPHCHMMKLKKGQDPMNPSSWEEPVKVMNVDGGPLTKEGITLDMTHVPAGGVDYLLWSERYNIGTSLDSGSMIYISTIDPKMPYRITKKPVLLTRPLLGWENVAGTINNEGPYTLKHGGKVYVAYSGGSANDTTYAVGYLIADENADLLDLNSWTKQNTPSLWAYSAENIDGPGHNSFFVDEDGHTMIAYHGQLGIRCSAIHRVHFDKNDYPYLNMSKERDLPEVMRDVEIEIE